MPNRRRNRENNSIGGKFRARKKQRYAEPNSHTSSDHPSDLDTSDMPLTDEFGRELRPPSSPRLRPNSQEPIPPSSSQVPDSQELSEPISLPKSPTPSYLALSDEPSIVSNPNNIIRKLLILDLNGTIVRRSPRNPRNANGHKLRVVYGRPYLPSLKAYLFHPDTKLWLDTMIWSSAQPHSVKDMVQKGFGDDEIVSDEWISGSDGERGRRVMKCRNLLTIWARDTLGLSEKDYGNKVQTIKDLRKPWTELSPNPDPSNISSQTDSSSAPQSFQIHSALSTILLDDSPSKTVLQPYNHLCIKEYDTTAWQDSMMAKRRLNAQSQISPSPDGQIHKIKSKRLEKLAAQREEVLRSAAEMDVALLALIGILDSLKDQSNVANWIRRGELFAGYSPSSPEEDKEEDIASTPSADASEDPLEATTSQSPPDAVTGAPSTSRSPTGVRSKSPTAEREVSLVSAVSNADDAPKPLMWFDNSIVVDHWAERGRAALSALDLDAVDGVTPIDL